MGGGNKAMKVLIVDDSKFSQIILAKHLQELFADQEIQIVTASDGQEGFDKYKEDRPDYVFIDLLMPNVNGQKLVSLINEYDSNHKIFIVSADVQKSVKDEMESFGIMKFINKPLNSEKAKLIYEIIKEDIR